jgi:enoyl-CoA hydratase/carnithine racemase
MSTTNPLRVHRETSAYWRVVFDYPPFNVLDGTVFQALQDLLEQIEADSALRAVVFETQMPTSSFRTLI